MIPCAWAGREPALGVSAGVYGIWVKVQGTFLDCLFRQAVLIIAASYLGEEVGLTHRCGSRCLSWGMMGVVIY